MSGPCHVSKKSSGCHSLTRADSGLISRRGCSPPELEVTSNRNTMVKQYLVLTFDSLHGPLSAQFISTVNM